jgi:2-haloacid dehalogenase
MSTPACTALPLPDTTPAGAPPAFDPAAIEVLAFDTFGTVVDWHGSIQREMAQRYPQVDGAAFALAWRAGYQPAMARVMRGELGWTRIDELHRHILDDIVPRFGLAHLSDAERSHLNRVWHRLDAWPDAVAGLERLRRRYIVTPLSNGNIGLLTRMAKRAGLPWDCVLSAEVFRAYKPHPDTYLGVARVFDLAPQQVMLVAAHHDDLAAARSCGLHTAYIERPAEYGLHQPPKDVSPRAGNDMHCVDFLALADRLGC